MDPTSKKAIIEKKIHEEKAFKIVSQLALETVDENFLLTIIKYIEPHHYEEIVEERFLSITCGYPVCSNELKNIPSQKYHISKMNKVHDIADRKRYCSGQCYKSSKYLESQISTVPIWLRKQTESKQVKLWSTSTHEIVTDDYDLKFNKDLIQPSVEALVINEIGNEIISKSQLYTNEIEVELNKIETEWKMKFKLDEIEPKKVNKTNIFKRTNVNDKNRSNLEINSDQTDQNQAIASSIKLEEPNKKFLETTQIHQKPKDFYHLAQIFSIKKSNETSLDDIDLNIVDEQAMNQLFFIEYLIQRIKALITQKSKDYLFDNQSNEKSKIQVERERIENLKKYEQYITKKNVWFSDLMNSSDKPKSEKSLPLPSNYIKEGDNGEAEMLAKIEFLNKSEPVSTHSHEDTKSEFLNEVNENEAKRPLPDYNKLREEAMIQQLKIKEFFMPSSNKSKQVQFKEEDEAELDQNDATYSQSLLISVKETNEEICRVLPTVDSLSQIEIRRKIFYEKLIK